MRAFWRHRRVLIPAVLAVLCLIVSGYVSPILAWALVMAAFGLLLDAGLALMPTNGGLGSHQQ
jgi:hypothetical protein